MWLWRSRNGLNESFVKGVNMTIILKEISLEERLHRSGMLVNKHKRK